MLPQTFTARLQKSPNKGGWTYVIWPKSVAFFQTHGNVKILCEIDGIPCQTSFMAMGNGTHMLPVKASIRQQANKQAGDTVQVRILERVMS